MKRLLVLLMMLSALIAVAVNVTNYPMTNDFSLSEWFWLSSIPQKTNFNLPGNYVASTSQLNAASNSILNQFTNTINATSNSILSQMTNSINSVSNSILNQVTNSFASATNFNGIVVTNTALVNQLEYYTNATMAPDFAKGYSWTNVSAAFTFLAPLHVDPTGKKVQTAVMMVTNSSGAAIAVAAPANVHVVPGSVMFITNVTAFTFSSYPLFLTNLYAVPIF